MKYLPINPELFRHNRQRFSAQLPPQSLAIFHSNDRMPRNGDQTFPFRQNSHLFSLSGIDQEESVLLLFPDCVREEFREVLFIRRIDERTAIWEGQKLSKQAASEQSGVRRICWIDELDRILHQMMVLAEHVFLNLNENEYFHSEVPSRDLRFAQQLQARYPLHRYHRSQALLRRLSMIKSELEVALIQQAIDITGLAFQRVLGFVRPGVMEYEVEAEITHEFLCNRATGHAYPPIVASGIHSCVLHYNANNQRCNDGDVLLFDFVAEYANYAADLSRTIPVNGRFSERQAAVYLAVLKVMRQATQLLLPGTSLQDYHQQVGRLMEGELLQLGLISQRDIDEQDPAHPAYKRYFMHGTSHHLGLDVHDLSNRFEPVQAGMVFTVEPGIYIPEERIGVRIENNILVRESGPVDLTANIPVELEAIETAMSQQVWT